MLNKEQLKRVKEALPPHGYQLIADVMGDITAEGVRQAMTTPERFKNREDISAAIVIVMDNYKKKQAEQANKLMSAIK